MDNHNSTLHSPGLIRSRIANACDGCKSRKVKCDGHQPCSYCVRRQRPQACHYSPSRRSLRRQTRAQQQQQQCSTLPRTPPCSIGKTTRDTTTTATTATDSSVDDEQTADDDDDDDDGGGDTVGGTRVGRVSASPMMTRRQALARPGSPDDETEVPREGRLLSDSQGKLIFIGDCAPLSLFQSVRQLVTRYVGTNAFAPETSRYSVLENATGESSSSSAYLPSSASPPMVTPVIVRSAVEKYNITTAGLVDLFDNSSLVQDILLWANLQHKPRNLTSTINYLILAIGLKTEDEAFAQVYYEHACDQAWRSLSGNLSVGTIQAFVLMTIYMLCSCQINSAFLVFGVAARAAYSIGVHRTEVNARFGPESHRQRDRMWKSLRVVDLFLSTFMGRPPVASDVDCTVPYRADDEDGYEVFDILNASAQIFLIVESIVIEIYSRKKISLQLTEGMSHQLREWSSRWLQRLKNTMLLQSAERGNNKSERAGACRVLATYYYAVMLVSRPFLMYELCRRLSEGTKIAGAARAPSAPVTVSGKSKLADACIDAASLMVESILDLIHHRVLDGREPLIVSWLFASSLVLGIGLIGGFGRILEKHTRMSIQALDHFSKSDTHAYQYSLIAQSLLTTALEHLEKRELQDRLRRTESSSQLFGLTPHEGNNSSNSTSSPAQTAQSRPQTSLAVAAMQVSSPANAPPMSRSLESQNRPYSPRQSATTAQVDASPRLGDIDSAFLGMSESLMTTPDADFWSTYLQGPDGEQASAVNLFPLLEGGGGIDLAHYL